MLRTLKVPNAMPVIEAPPAPKYPSSELVWITPEMAAEWLTRNSVNRPLRESLVEKYARDMKAGNWKITGEAIKFEDGTENIEDGQHRLWAIIESGAAVAIFVVRGLDSDAQNVMDSGAGRTAADNLTMSKGISKTNTVGVAALARIMVAYEAGLDINQNSHGITNTEIYNWVDAWMPDAEIAANLGKRYGHRVLQQPSTIAFASWLIWQQVKDWAPVEAFWDAAANKVELKHGDPVIALTNKFAVDRGQGRRPKRQPVVSGIIRAWNARRVGKKMFTVKYGSPGADAKYIPIPAVVS